MVTSEEPLVIEIPSQFVGGEPIKIEGTQIIETIKPIHHNYRFVKRTVIKDFSGVNSAESPIERVYEQSDFSLNQIETFSDIAGQIGMVGQCALFAEHESEVEGAGIKRAMKIAKKITKAIKKEGKLQVETSILCNYTCF